ncbi:MAG TPA: hypothetical protein VE732_04180, partial [Nitrososphaera sp.]|nr:hypothetical protein [Nitrososphaera sp.]
ERISQSELSMRAWPEEVRKAMRQPPEPYPMYVTIYKLNTPNEGEYVIEDSFFTPYQWQIIRQATNIPSGQLSVIRIRKYDDSSEFSYVVWVRPKGERHPGAIRALHFYGRVSDGRIQGVEGVLNNFTPKTPGKPLRSLNR